MKNQFKIRIGSINDAALFVKKCSEFEENIDYIKGRYVIDAKSLMGVLSVDLRDFGTIEIHTDDNEIINKFKEEMKLWMEDEEDD